jgi:hypothetical protein
LAEGLTEGTPLADPVQAGPVQAGPVQADPVQADPVQAEPQAPALRTAAPIRRRFVFVYVLLAIALISGITSLVIFASRSIDPGPSWSAWKPSGGGLGAAKQIAEHVSPKYRLPDGNQLVDVIARGASVSAGGQSIPIPLIAVRGPKGKISQDNVVQVGSSDTYTFSLCGLGDSCSIATGKPSAERATLVRREILELALYTFKYVKGVKHIVAFMPPPKGTPPSYVVYLQKDDLKGQLGVPLTQTLKPKAPLPNQITSTERSRIDGVTEPRIYKFGLSQTQQGDAVLVLQPLQA